MRTRIGQLQDEHHRLRRLLAAARGAVAMAPETTFVVRALCFALAKHLEAHCQREAEAIAVCEAPGWGGGEDALASLPVDHQDHLHSLRIITRHLIAGKPSGPADEVYRALSAVVEGLEEEMQLQEGRLFPLLLALQAHDDQPTWALWYDDGTDSDALMAQLHRRRRSS